MLGVSMQAVPAGHPLPGVRRGGGRRRGVPRVAGRGKCVREREREGCLVCGAVVSNEEGGAPAPLPALRPEAMEGEGAGMGGKGVYGAKSIKVLKGLEPVRLRPGMYIGSTGAKGLHHLIWEVVDNSIDECQAGHADRIRVELLADGSVAVQDNGRGIPTDVHQETGVSALETVLTVLHAGGKFENAAADGEGDGNQGYKVSGGLHGVGISVVNALSSRLEVTVLQSDGSICRQGFVRGEPTAPMHREQAASAGDGASHAGAGFPAVKGTRVVFLPDPDVFRETTVYSRDVVASRLRELAFLNGSVKIELIDRRTFDGSKIGATKSRGGEGEDDDEDEGEHHDLGDGGEDVDEDDGGARKAQAAWELDEEEEEESGVRADGEDGPSASGGSGGAAAKAIGWTKSSGALVQEFHYPGGLREYVGWLSKQHTPIHEPFHFSVSGDAQSDADVARVDVEVAMCWSSDSYSTTVLGYANSIRTPDGGAHVEGLRAAVTKVVNMSARKLGRIKEGEPNMSGDHVREGMGCVVSVRLPDPQFEGQTKSRLGNPEVRRAVDAAVTDHLKHYLDTHSEACDAIITKALEAQRAAEAMKRARDLSRRKSVLRASALPGKLSDCSPGTKPEDAEIFIVEGDSAGGSAKQARNRVFQAILPLKGKILNVERKDDATLYASQEVQNLINALGLGLKGESLDLKRLRYQKIILLTDADVDGSHIRTLLLTFFYRYQPELFDHGFVYVGVPPLYKVEESGARSKKAGGTRYVYNEAEREAAVRAMDADGVKYSLQRFKGLGEMMPQQLWDTTLNPETRALRRVSIDDVAGTEDLISLLMGGHVAPRRSLIESEGIGLDLGSLDI